MKQDEISEYMEALFKRDESIKSVILVQDNLEGITIFPEDFISSIRNIWEIFEKVLKYYLKGLSIYSEQGVGHVSFTLNEYFVVCVPLFVGNSLVVFTKGKAKDIEKYLKYMDEEISNISKVI